MEYIINNYVSFNSSDGTLFCQDDSIDMITLNRVCNELLLLFIQNVGVPISRDKLLNELWEKKGLSASNNNLNNYVSMLRKALAQCGCPGVISTIPKHGFLFEADIIYIAPSVTSPAVTEDNQSPSSPLGHGDKGIGTDFFSSKKIKITIFFLVLLTAGVTTYIHENLRLNSVRSEIFRYQQCRFYLIDDMTRRLDRGKVINRINAIIKDEEINCAIKTNVYFSADKKRNTSGNYVFLELLGYCTYKSKAPCENYIYSRGEGVYENKN
ncbi:winged helix-turn-helix domain-containing protein [Serratia proteamaculans]|uniref:winged helix-turn-helix domain-containing protein n=1 Tax=Serratia proteamaculans TaxID=28151 RepID=UPI00298296FB|nr:winged helix-turn-helix domain-containing protein [Serratia proteamaculans]MDW5512084.1 winged helix-turn-helix domain-containing protein [Serratia proteamaculans]